MKILVLSALALPTLGASGFASSGTEAWLTFDKELESLSNAPAQTQVSGLSVNGFVRASYSTSSDITVGGNDLGGFSIDNIRLNLTGNRGGFSFLVSLEGSTDPGAGYFGNTGVAGDVTILDAMASTQVTDQVVFSAGQFRHPFLGSALIDENHLLFLDRTINGEIWDSRDQGVMFNGTWDQIGWWIAGMNGGDGAGDEYALTGRVAFHALGTGAGMSHEGAYGAGSESNLTIAAAISDDGSVDDGQAIALEAAFSQGALSAAFETVDYDDDIGDATPWSATVGYMFQPETWEAAVRFEDFDDSFDTTMITVGVNRYIEGHNAKWGVNYSTIDSDATDADVIAIGMTVGV
jgi:hypothetical protein